MEIAYLGKLELFKTLITVLDSGKLTAWDGKERIGKYYKEKPKRMG